MPPPIASRCRRRRSRCAARCRRTRTQPKPFARRRPQGRQADGRPRLRRLPRAALRRDADRSTRAPTARVHTPDAAALAGAACCNVELARPATFRTRRSTSPRTSTSQLLQVQAMSRRSRDRTPRRHRLLRARRDALPRRCAPALRRRARRARSQRCRGGRSPETGSRRRSAFANYHETMAFVNARRVDRAPRGPPSRPRRRTTTAASSRASTHDAGGVTLNDVICAAKTERLVA